MNPTTTVGILESERNFFDCQANELHDTDLRLREDQIERYRNARPRPGNTPKDRLFAELLPVQGKRILDYGCGTGELSCELALCGAQVTGFDLSPASIAGAWRRAELHGLEDRIRFDVRQAGNTGYPSAGFDIIVGSAILHHLHTEMPVICAEIDRLLAPDGVACFIEPVANSGLLRVLRRWVPVKCDATPDERQLRYDDFAPLRRHFRRLEFHHFYCLDRFRRVVGERMSRPLRWADAYLQKFIPFLRSWYGIVLMIARR